MTFEETELQSLFTDAVSWLINRSHYCCAVCVVTLLLERYNRLEVSEVNISNSRHIRSNICPWINSPESKLL